MNRAKGTTEKKEGRERQRRKGEEGQILQKRKAQDLESPRWLATKEWVGGKGLGRSSGT